MTKEEEKYTTLDTEQCKWWVITLFSMAKSLACQTNNFDDAKEIQSAQDKIIKALETVEEFKRAQIITGGRLNGRTYAYKCGLEDGKRKALEQQPCDDLVNGEDKKLDDSPFVEIGMCKDCKHWKDSDGVYRRGIGAESKCPVNSSRVFEGTFCCAAFEKRGNEDGSN